MKNNIRTEEGILCTEVHKKNKNNVIHLEYMQFFSSSLSIEYTYHPFIKISLESIELEIYDPIIHIIHISSLCISIKGYLEKFFFLFPIFSTLFLFFLCTSVHKIPSSVRILFFIFDKL